MTYAHVRPVLEAVFRVIRGKLYERAQCSPDYRIFRVIRP